MSVRMHITRAKTGSRRAHIRLATPAVIKDAATGSITLRHMADPTTGMYRGKQILDLTKKTNKIAKRRAAKAEKKGGS